MNFLVATLRESKQTVIVNMANIMTMIVRKLRYNTNGAVECGTYTEIALVNGDALEVDESPAELINVVI